MINELIKLADFLDSRGLCKEADYLDHIIKMSESMPPRLHGGKRHPNPLIINVSTISVNPPEKHFDFMVPIKGRGAPAVAAARDEAAKHFGVLAKQIRIRGPIGFTGNQAKDPDGNFPYSALPEVLYTDVAGNSANLSDPLWLKEDADGVPHWNSEAGRVKAIDGLRVWAYPKEETEHPSWTDPNWGPE